MLPRLRRVLRRSPASERERAASRDYTHLELEELYAAGD